MGRVHSLPVLIAFVAALLLAGCGAGGGVVAFAVVKGLVTGASGVALAGVTIRSGTATTTSGSDGSYSLSLPSGAGRKVTASRAGFVDTFQVVSLAAGQTAPMDLALNPVGQSTPLTSLLTTPATATDPRGAEVNLAANTLVDSSGSPVDAATVDVTTALPSDAKFGASFPGLFVGNKAGADADIESFGFVNIDVTTNTGLACNLKPGATADIAIPVAPASDPGTPTIDLWSLDEATGKWLFVVAATRDASGAPVVYRAPVTHFSTYNLDQPITSSMPLTVTVQASTGGTVAGASVVVTSTNQTSGGVWSGRGTTGPNGTVFFPSVPQGFLSARVISPGLTGIVNHYNVDNSTASLTITLYPGVVRTFSLVYLDNGVQKPLPNDLVYVTMDDGGPFIYINTTADGNGQVTMELQDGHANYQYHASGTVGGTTYVINASAPTVAAIPTVWVLQ